MIPHPHRQTLTAQSEAVQTYRKQGYYIVQAGDSLRQISYSVYQTFTMVDAICKANHITDQDATWQDKNSFFHKKICASASDMI